MSSPTISSGLKNTIPETTFLSKFEPLERYDVTIRFLSAEGLPKTDIIGHSDPYFIASIDKKITYTSTIISNTGEPVWKDEEWIVRNIPNDAKLFIVLFDKDDEKPLDDHIGQFELDDIINYQAPTQGHPIRNFLGHGKGHFHLSIDSQPSTDETKQLPAYTFDGPCRYFCHSSIAVGRLTMLKADCAYLTWKIQIKRISVFFPPYQRQHWNTKYHKAKAIFSDCPTSLLSRLALKAAHKGLYERTLKNSEHGRLESADDLWKHVFTDTLTDQIRPCIYTYIIDDHTWRFSETGHQIFKNIASKHALLANGSEYVLYAGEFHLRPKYGWDRCDDEWELVIDNGSGTYSPSADLLENLKQLLIFNFPGLNVVTYDYKDPKLKESVEQLKEFRKQNKTSSAVGHLCVTPPTEL